MPDVVASDTGGESPVLKGTIQMETRIVPALIMADPRVTLRVNVRRFRMSGPIIEGSGGRLLLSSAFVRARLRLRLLSSRRRCGSHRRGPMRRNMPTTDFLALLRWASAPAFFRPLILCAHSDAHCQGGQYTLNHESISHLWDAAPSAVVTTLRSAARTTPNKPPRSRARKSLQAEFRPPALTLQGLFPLQPSGSSLHRTQMPRLIFLVGLSDYGDPPAQPVFHRGIPRLGKRRGPMRSGVAGRNLAIACLVHPR
jgi:hypothetical protein